MGWRVHGAMPGNRQRFSSSPEHPLQFWCPPNVPISGCHSRWSTRMTTHLHLVPRLRMSAAISSRLCIPSWRAAGLYCYHTYKSMTSRKDGYLFVVEYFIQYSFIICLDKIFRHKSPKPLFYNGHLKLAEPSSAKTQTCS